MEVVAAHDKAFEVLKQRHAKRLRQTLAEVTRPRKPRKPVPLDTRINIKEGDFGVQDDTVWLNATVGERKRLLSDTKARLEGLVNEMPARRRTRSYDLNKPMTKAKVRAALRKKITPYRSRRELIEQFYVRCGRFNEPSWLS